MFQNSLRFFSSLIALYQSITSDIFWYILSCYFCSISSDFFFKRWSTLSPLLLFPFNCFHPFILSLVAQTVKNLPAMWVDLGSIPGLGRCPGERNGYPLQYFGLENSMDSMGSQRVWHDWVTFTFTLFFHSSVVLSIFTLLFNRSPELFHLTQLKLSTH